MTFQSWYEHSRTMVWTKRRLRLKIRIDLYNLWVAWLCLNWKIEYLFCIGCYRAIFRIDRGVQTLLISAYDNYPRRAFRVLQKWQKWLKWLQMTIFISKRSHSTTGQFFRRKKLKTIWAVIMLFMGDNIKSIGQNCEFHKKLFWNDSFFNLICHIYDSQQKIDALTLLIWLLEVWLVDRRWPIKCKCLLSVFNPISKLIFWREVHLEHVHLNHHCFQPTLISTDYFGRGHLKLNVGPFRQSGIHKISGPRNNVAGKRVFGVFIT